MLNYENLPKDSFMYEIIKTTEPSDEFRSSIENIFNIDSKTFNDIEIMCGCFKQDQQQIRQLNRTITAKNHKINVLERQLKQSQADYEGKIKNLKEKVEIRVDVLIVELILFIIFLIYPLNQ
jgi:vacuolar-type H+-ATPase subunit I/STV1